MQKVATAFFFPITLVLVLSAAATHAQMTSSTNVLSLEDNFTPGFHEFNLGFGPMFSPIGNDEGRPVVNWVEGDVQLGYMLTSIHGDDFLGGILRGNVELVGEAWGAGIYEETGSYIAGGTIWGRYNLIPKGAPLVPYLQVGIGGEMMDINHQYDGHEFNFNVCGAGGARYFLRPNLALNAELRLRHLSNANTADHNIGINALGPIVGISWFF
jgi:lipid A 3-O-deacylase